MAYLQLHAHEDLLAKIVLLQLNHSPRRYSHRARLWAQRAAGSAAL